jgi:hypothetical protein
MTSRWIAPWTAQRPIWSRPAVVVLLATGLVACGGGGGSSDTQDVPPEQRKNTLNASQPGELTAYVQERLRTLNASGRLAGGARGAGDALPPTAAAPSPAANAAPPSRSSTVVQEAGVDEADLIQNDGRWIYTLYAQVEPRGLTLQAYERGADGRAVRMAALPLASDGAMDINTQGMVPASDFKSLAVISQNWSTTPVTQVCPNCADVLPGLTIAPIWFRSSVNVQRVDVSNPAQASAGTRVNIDGFLVDSRRVGDRLYVVTQHRPPLPVEQLPANATHAEREAAIARITAADLLPKVRVNGGVAEPLLKDTDCFLQPANASTSIELTTVTVFDLKSPALARTSRCFVGGSEALYMTQASLYLATTRWVYNSDNAQTIFPPEFKTDIHKFALQGDSIGYQGSGAVDGSLGWDRERRSFRLSEHNGDLRVLSFTGSSGWFGTPGNVQGNATAPSPARLTILRENAGSLAVVSTLPNSNRPALIGKPGEQVYAVRFVGDRGYVVTFRRIDPLYVLDLSNPADPKTVGELEVAGFSDHLFPLPGNLLLGVGKDADTQGRTLGVKIALFDVANPAAPSERASVVLGTSGSVSALDQARHGLNLMTVGNVTRMALPTVLAAKPFADWSNELQRFEVDSAARTLKMMPAVAAVNNGSSAQAAVWLQRATQIDNDVYYFNNGDLTSHDW